MRQQNGRAGGETIDLAECSGGMPKAVTCAESVSVWEPGRRCRMVCDLFCFVLCLLVMCVQLAALDYYFIQYLKQDFWYAWIAGDVIVVLVMVWLLSIAVRYNQRCMKRACSTDANIKYAYIGWFAYSILLAAKIACTFILYADKIGKKEFLSRDIYKINLALSAVIFLLLIEAHHYTRLNSPRQQYLNYLSTAISLDLLDSIYFLNILWNSKAYKWDVSNTLYIAMLALTCINFVLPTFALLKLRYAAMPKWLCLPYEKVYALIYTLIVNVPYLAIRVYLFVQFRTDIGHGNDSDSSGGVDSVKTQEDYDMSVFVIKNAIMIFISVKECYQHALQSVHRR